MGIINFRQKIFITLTSKKALFLFYNEFQVKNIWKEGAKNSPLLVKLFQRNNINILLWEDARLNKFTKSIFRKFKPTF